MMFVDNAFNIGQVVYLKTDPERLPRIVIGINISGKDVRYELSHGSQADSTHFDFEISAEKHSEVIA